mgnify:CR=1 FL=1
MKIHGKFEFEWGDLPAAMREATRSALAVGQGPEHPFVSRETSRETKLAAIVSRNKKAARSRAKMKAARADYEMGEVAGSSPAVRSMGVLGRPGEPTGLAQMAERSRPKQWLSGI